MYGLHLGRALWGQKGDRIGARRLAALINGLDHASALARSIDPDSLGRGWDTKTELLASIAEMVHEGNRLFLSAHVEKGTRLPRPLRIPRPTDDARHDRVEGLKRFAADRGIPIVTPKSKRARAAQE